MTRSLRALAKHALRAVGLDVVRVSSQETLGAHMRALLSLLGVTCVLDVGAHQGEYGQQLRYWGYQGEIVSFEPIEANYRLVAALAKSDGHWRAHRLALGAEEGSLPIHVARATVFSSFLAPNAFGTQRFGEKPAATRTEVVPVRRLDRVLDELVAHVASPRIFLKIDTQGFDRFVLEGAAGVLGRVLALQTEVAAKPIYEGVPALPEALTHLASLGFEVSGLFPVSRDTDGLRVVEFDCVAVRRDPT